MVQFLVASWRFSKPLVLHLCIVPGFSTHWLEMSSKLSWTPMACCKLNGASAKLTNLRMRFERTAEQMQADSPCSSHALFSADVFGLGTW